MFFRKRPATGDYLPGGPLIRRSAAAATRGPELIGNGTFNDNTGLTNVNATVSGGQLVLGTNTGIASSSAQNCAITNGLTYEIKYDIVSITPEATTGVRATDSGLGTQSRSNVVGTRSEIITATSTTTTIKLSITAGQCVIDNFSIKRVLA